MKEGDINFHTPVLLHKTIEYLINPEIEDHVIVDCTAGGGGHSELISDRIGINGKLICIDKDEYAVKKNEERFKEKTCPVRVIRGNFGDLDKILENEGIDNITGILMDLGLSTYQLENEPGFSFMRESELDMRADNRDDLKASDILNTFPKEELEKIFTEYGEIANSGRLAGAILRYRKIKKIKTTTDLIEAVNKEYSLRKKDTNDFYAKIFQSLRIEVNNELKNLENVLSVTTRYLVKGGRIVVISYHSLEDRIVKNFFRENKEHYKILTKKPVIPDYKEIKNNRRSRSAKLRSAEKI
jgi:16S rRNA (cytosine1402-N4)-methyltransferase